jgi:ATP-binding cassette subfamily C protein
MADAVESSALAGDTPARRVRQRSAWRLPLGHVRPYRWMILCGGFLGFLGELASLVQPMAAKLAVDTLGQHRSLAGPAALLPVMPRP